MKLLAGAATTAGLSIALLGGVTPAATAEAPVSAAVTCTGTGCDNKDPYATGCGASRVESGRKATTKGTFILYFSRTCQTNWIETPNFAGGTPSLELTVWDRARNKTVRFNAPPTRGRHWGNMVYSPGTSCAVGFADWDADSAWEVIIESSGC